MPTWLRKAAFVGLALCFATLHAVMTGLLGASHRFYLPMYSMVALAAERTTGAAASDPVALFSGFTLASAGLAKSHAARTANLWIVNQLEAHEAPGLHRNGIGRCTVGPMTPFKENALFNEECQRWMAVPEQFIVTVVETTIEQQRKRVMELNHEASQMIG